VQATTKSVFTNMSHREIRNVFRLQTHGQSSTQVYDDHIASSVIHHKQSGLRAATDESLKTMFLTCVP
jgi:hypothetical protein